MSEAGVLQLWEIDLAADDAVGPGAAGIGDMAELLTDGDRTRANLLADPRDRMRLIRSHAAARALLAAAVGVPPGQVEQEAGPNGKPVLTESSTTAAVSGVEWNMSRSGFRALVAIGAAKSGAAPIGVDIQVEHSHGDPLAVARRFFTPAEGAWVAASPTGQARVRRLCVLLARKEAVAKAGGGRLLDVLRCDVMKPGPKRWQDEQYYVADVSVRRGYAGAIAARGRPIGELAHHVCDWRDLCALN